MQVQDSSAACEPARRPTARRWSLLRAGDAVPRLLLLTLVIGLVVYVITQGAVHGTTYDEALQNEYGRRVFHWYVSFGSDRGFLHFPVRQQMPEHGPAFETFVAALQSLSGHLFATSPWTARTLVCGLTGVLGVGVAGLCGRAVKDWWTGLAAAVGLALYPRYIGAIFNNSKDVPLAVGYLVVLLCLLHVIRSWEGSPRRRLLWCSALGVALGVTISIRIVAISWLPIMAVLAAACLWARRRESLRSDAIAAATSTGVMGAVAYLTVLATWPFVLLHPVTGLLTAYRSMAKYPWDNAILYDGKMVSAERLPRTYLLHWLWIGSPYLTVLLALAGVIVVLIATLRGRPDPLAAALALGGLVPIAAVVATRPTLYNGLRHLLFAVPPLVVLAAWALVVGLRAVWHLRAPAGRWVAALLAGGVLLTQVQVLAGMARLYPYEYTYFNAVGGGFTAYHRSYETDYWGTCNRAAVLWLRSNWHHYSAASQVTMRTGWVPPTDVVPYLGNGLRIGVRGTPPDFAVYSLIDWRANPWPTYTLIHNVAVEGTPLCEVLASPRLAPSASR